jgi:CheY-like chemotaxis protein
MLTTLKPRSSARASTHREAPVAIDTHILIVESDRDVATALTAMLATRGYEDVRAVRSAPRAVTLSESFRPVIVFLDIESPSTEGLELANRLRQGAGRRALRLIALTNEVEHELRETARAAGFERYLVKPVVQVELDKVLRLPVQPA